LGLQAVFREVRTEDELRQALTPLETSAVNRLANTGRRIVIAAPMTITSPIIITRAMEGTTIEAHGHIPLRCGVDGIDAFDVRAPLCTIRGLVLYGAAAEWNRAFVLGAFALSCQFRNNYIGSAAQLIVDESAGGATGCIVDGNTFFAGGANTSIDVDSQRWRVTSNVLVRTPGGLAVRVGANGGVAHIAGNHCDSQGITTSASNGFNTISSNTLAGTITSHGTDAVGLNT
jgi:hypothetical protein